MRSLSLSLVGATACTQTNDTDKPPGDVIGVFTPKFTMECPTATCPMYVRFDPAEMATCFGWDPDEYPGVGWPPEAPDDLDISWCNPELQQLPCDLPLVDTVSTELNPACNCVTAEDITTLDCCLVDDQLEPEPEAWWGLVSPEFFAVVLTCIQGDVIPYYDHDECVLDEVPEWEECDFLDGFSVAPGADYVLTVDPGLSYVEIASPLGTESFSLSGGGSAATGPARFMTGLVWAENGAIGTHDLTSWHFWLDVPIDLDVNSGAFVVEADDDPYVMGSGYDDAQGLTIKAVTDEDASGTLTATTWELDFDQTAFGWTVEVHLEGDVEAVD